MSWKVGLVITAILVIVVFGAHALQDCKSSQLSLCQQDCNNSMSECLTTSDRETLSCETLHFMCNVTCGSR